MASVTIRREDMFPVGTEVSAYLVAGEGRQPASGPPPGSPLAVGTVAGDGSLTLSGLAEKRTHWLYAGSPDRYLLVNTSVSQSAQSGSADQVTVAPPVNGQENVQDSLEDLDSRITTGNGTIVSDDGEPLGTLDLVEDAEMIRAATGTVADDDARLTDARTPSNGSVTNAQVASDAAIAESKLDLASDAAAHVASRRTLGTGAQQAAAGDHTHSTLPSSDEKAALAGTEGTPGASNPYATGSDPRLIVTLLWDAGEDDYVPIGGVSAEGEQVRHFVGLTDPADRSWTLNPGDIWDETE